MVKGWEGLVSAILKFLHFDLIKFKRKMMFDLAVIVLSLHVNQPVTLSLKHYNYFYDV